MCISPEVLCAVNAPVEIAGVANGRVALFLARGVRVSQERPAIEGSITLYVEHRCCDLRASSVAYCASAARLDATPDKSRCTGSGPLV